MKLSIVTTLYNSSAYIAEFYRRITAEAEKITQDFEIIFVDDGSPDDSLKNVLAIQEGDPKVKVIELSRNFGHHNAMLAGLRHCCGNYVFLIDVDLEEKPENLGSFWRTLQANSGVDVVYGVNQDRKTEGFKKLYSQAFYRIFNLLSDTKIENNELVSRLMTREFVNALIKNTEAEIFLPSLWASIGFNKMAVPTSKTFDGRSSYTLKKQLIMAYNAIVSSSSFPLHVIFYLGLLISISAGCFAFYLIISVCFFYQPLVGWTSLMVSIYLLGGLTIASLGVIGLYVSKVFIQVKSRPTVIVRHIYQGTFDAHRESRQRKSDRCEQVGTC